MTIFGLFSKLLDFIYPTKCIGCNKSDSYLCDKCISIINKPKIPENNYIEPLFEYRNKIIEKAIWKLKYHGIRDISNIFGQLIYEKIIPNLSEDKIFNNIQKVLLIPIPITENKLKERGFNQTILIVESIMNQDRENLFIYEPNLLIKTRETKSQMTIRNRAERLKNVKNSFKITDKSKVINQNIILIDDITTTGATLSEARKVLLEAGATSVSAYTIAH